MIKVGDKVILDGVEYVIKEIKGNDVLLVKCDDALNIKFINEKTLCAKLYEQQKQRADQLEQRWEKLKEHFNKEKEQSFGILSWSRNNGMLELMQRFEEDCR